MGNFDDARRLLQPDEPPTCPGCGEQRLVEPIGPHYVCAVCSFKWRAPRPDHPVARVG